MGSLATLYAIGGATLLVGGLIWYISYQAKKKGIAEQVARDLKTVADVESQIHGVQAEERGPEKTKRKLRDKTF